MVSPEKREPLFINCCDLIMRDGRIEPEEEHLIESLQARLVVEDSFAREAVSLLLMKYRL